MKKSVVVILIIVGVVILIGLIYYFLIYKKEQQSRESTDATSGGSGSGNGTTPIVSVGEDVYLKTDKSAWAGDNGIPVYNKDVANNIGSFLEGVTRGDWYPSTSIGKVIEKKSGWVKVKLNNLQIWKFYVNQTTLPVGTIVNGVAIVVALPVKGYTQIKGYLTGDYWFSDKALITY